MADIALRVVETPIEEEMKRSYIDYSMSVIVSRALPDVRDGLKPVQRRIIYSMDELGVRHDKPHKKAARLVGETMGKYHPHGDMAIYDALVRLAQPFNMRYPLVDGHGNFGSIDGDAPAAMRYTEARLTAIAEELLVDIDKDTVDFMPNFDDTLKEPVVLPSRIPNLLVNGSSGIAVGMATNIPPHNLGEVVDALVALIDNPEIDSMGLMKFIKGPDFPTGGLVVGIEAVKALYATGRGIITLRAKTRIEREKSGRQSIVVDELPYQVNKARLIESIAELVRDKKIQGVTDLRDESDKSGLRVVIEVRKDVEPEVVLNQLFRHTALETSFGGIMLALVDGKPQVLDLKGILWHYILHRKDVVTRRTRFELRKAEERAHILAGLEIALDNLDEVIALIRSSGSPDEARKGLMERFGLDEVQARAILDMKLERLTRLERDKIIEERRNLLKEIEYLRAVLSSESLLMGIIRKELEDIKKAYADERRTRIVETVEQIKEEELIVEEEVSVILTGMGYIKRMPLSTYRSQRRGGLGATAMQTREEDWVEKVVSTTTRESLLLFTNQGKAYWLKVFDVPEAGRQGKGYLVSKMVSLGADERVTALIPVRPDSKGDLFFMTRNGMCKRTPLEEFSSIRKTGIKAINLKEGDSLILARLVQPGDEVLTVTAGGKALRMKVDDVRPMGRDAAGVIGMRLSEGDYIVGADRVTPGGMVLLVSAYGYGKLTPLDEFPLHKRGGSGVTALKVTEKSGSLAVMRVVSLKDEAILVTAEGVAIRIKLSQVKVAHRPALGVRLMKIEPPDRLSACSILEGE
ncbi:MAG: DNA gyrase subunit A [Candidatus Fermentithermobacillus carboniphilus]|uniref:DNA gyrase subunit A n=1 Tax=Candidatus Fermentithermobacillus carboniphilus TaxID=3085328 RepID=A0AAT9L9U4_9FIRM|nr:MAG: DNA gyrase subunit A [Candidatus Fermentithermobacillus carboniphilus]